jgi:predicted ATPase with chaperone activity
MTTGTIPVPKTIEQTGVRRNLLEDLALKIVYLMGEISLLDLSRQIGLNGRIVEELFEKMRKEQLCQVTAMDRGVHRITTTSTGKSRALELLKQNQYTGVAPVSLREYTSRIGAQSVLEIRVTPATVAKAFEDVVLEAETLNQLGTAVVSGRALFLYGPTGTGKSLIAETLTKLFESDQVWVPHAVEVDGQIITIYDPVLHRKIERPKGQDQDVRWVLCRRPHVLVGGELTIEMLDLQLNPSTGFYTGPLQMKANNGILIVDDFGRQRVSPEELLNRWVVPLERRIDFVTLAGGRKIEIPFDLFLVFATNLDPAKLIDEAFLRRIQTKIKVGFVSPEQFHEIFKRVCLGFKLAHNQAAAEELIRIIGDQYSEPLRACYPRDILRQVVWTAQYRQREPVLDRESVAQACRAYFLET